MFKDLVNKEVMPAVFSFQRNTLFFQPSQKAWKDIKKNAIENHKKQFYSTNNENHIFNHEYAHYYFYNLNPERYLKLRNSKFRQENSVKLQNEISSNAKRNLIEFLSEVFAGLRDNKKYSKSIIRLYKKHGGR